MATYKYQAISKDGVSIDGVIKAHDQDEAVIKLKDDVETVLEISEVRETPAFLAKLFEPKVKEKDLALVCEQFSIILKAGLPIAKTIELVGNQTEDKTMKTLLSDVAEDVKGGSTLADAFEARGNNLPQTFIETIRAGEMSGKLDTSFDRLATYLNKKVATNNKVISALIYPAFVIFVAIAVVIILMVFAVPTFTATFADMGIDLPLPTRILIAVSNFFSKWIWLIALLVVIGIIVLNIWKRTESGRYNWDKFKFRIPLIGKVQKMSAASEFANSFSTMLAAGLPAVQALRVTGSAMTNYYVGRDIMDACADVEGGNKIADSLKKNVELPDMLLEITGIGEDAGTLEENLETIAHYYDREVEVAVNRATSMLEPIIIVILAVVVLFILLAVYLPMFSMYGNL